MKVDIQEWIATISDQLASEAEDDYELIESGIDRHGSFEWTFRRVDDEGNLRRFVIIAIDPPFDQTHDVEVWAGVSGDLQFTRRLVHSESIYPDGHLDLHIPIKQARSLADRLGAEDLDQTYVSPKPQVRRLAEPS